MLPFALIKAHFKRAIMPHRDGSPGHPASLLNALVGGLAVAAPVIFFAGRGRLPIGLGVALGALSVSRVSHAFGLGHRLMAPFLAFTAASLSVLVAYLLCGYGWWSDAATVLIASASALLMRFSRDVAIGVIRFMLFLIIFGNALEGAVSPGGLAVAIFTGVTWTALLVAVVELFAKGFIADQELNKPQQSAINRLKRVRRELRNLAQWDFPVRLAIGLTLSLFIRAILPHHHFGWITVTVALLTPRQFEAWPIRATQRALGTLGGVIATGFTFAVTLPTAVLIALLFVLGALRKWFEDRNYLAYSAVMAPLVLLLLMANHPNSYDLLYDRVLSTLIGVALVLLSNLVAAHTTSRNTIPSTAS